MDKYAKKYADVAIRQIKEGLYLDEFAKDKRASVRAAVVKYQPRYRKAVFDHGKLHKMFGWHSTTFMKPKNNHLLPCLNASCHSKNQKLLMYLRNTFDTN